MKYKTRIKLVLELYGMFLVQCEELKINYLTPILVVTMPTLVDSCDMQTILRTSSDIFIFSLGLCFEELFWERYVLKGQIAFEGHWRLQCWTLRLITMEHLMPSSICRAHSQHKSTNKGHFTHEPRVVTMKLWEPKRKCPKAVPTHLQNHVVWSQTRKCSVMSYVTGPSTKCYFNEFLSMRVLTHGKKKGINQRLWAFAVRWSLGFVLGLPPRGGYWK